MPTKYLFKSVRFFYVFFLFIPTQNSYSADKAVCGVTVLPTGESVKSCLQATWNLPTANLSVPNSAVTGSQITVSWTSIGAFQCTLSYPGNTLTGKSNAGFQVTINADTTFTLNCDGPGGSIAPIVKTVVASSGFTANLLISGLSGDQSYSACYKDLVITWSTTGGTGAVTCTLTPNPRFSPTPYPTPTPTVPPWTGATGNITNYSLQLDNALTATTTFTLSCSDSGGHSDTDVARITLNRQWPTDGHMTFISVGAFNGAMGGLSGADAKCQVEGDASGLRPGATWKAVLNTATSKARNRILLTGPVYTPVILQRPEQYAPICGGTGTPLRSFYVANGCGATVASVPIDFWQNAAGTRANWKFGRIVEATGVVCSRNFHPQRTLGNPPGAGVSWGNWTHSSGHGIHYWRGMTSDNSNCTGQTCTDWTRTSGSGNAGGNNANQGPWNDGTSPSTSCSAAYDNDTLHNCSTRLLIQCLSQ